MTDPHRQETRGKSTALTTSAEGRRERIARHIERLGKASVDDLAALYEVTPSTIRRDLARLESTGRLARTYGGVRAFGGSAEPTLSARAKNAYEQKAAIARRAVGLVTDGARIFLDGGSTVGALAQEVPHHARPHVVTSSLVALEEIRATQEIALELLGGDYRPTSESFFGPSAEMAVERMTFDAAFLSADAVHPEFGLCEAEPRQCRLKEMIAYRSGRVVVLAHSAKLGVRPFNFWARMPEHWTLVTDDSVDDTLIDAFSERGVEVIVAPSAKS